MKNILLKASSAAESPEDCIKNMARIGTKGMAQTDKEILNIMLEKR